MGHTFLSCDSFSFITSHTVHTFNHIKKNIPPHSVLDHYAIGRKYTLNHDEILTCFLHLQVRFSKFCTITKISMFMQAFGKTRLTHSIMPLGFFLLHYLPCTWQKILLWLVFFFRLRAMLLTITSVKGAWPALKNHPPLYTMKIEILVSEESLHFSHYGSEILGSDYISFRCYVQKRGINFHESDYHT